MCARTIRPLNWRRLDSLEKSVHTNWHKNTICPDVGAFGTRRRRAWGQSMAVGRASGNSPALGYPTTSYSAAQERKSETKATEAPDLDWLSVARHTKPPRERAGGFPGPHVKLQICSVRRPLGSGDARASQQERNRDGERQYGGKRLMTRIGKRKDGKKIQKT